MTDNEVFVKATNFLKHTRKLSFREIAESLKLKRHNFDSIRTGSAKPNEVLIEDLLRLYPELSKFYSYENSEDSHKALSLNEPEPPGYGQNSTLRELVDTQKELIDMQRRRLLVLEARVEQLEVLNTALRAENSTLKDLIGKRK